MLVFPGVIDRTDCGSPDVLVKPDKKEGFVLKVKASKSDFTPTNLTVFTKDGWMYSFQIGYNECPSQLVYECAGKDSLKAPRILHDKSMNIIKIQQYSQLIAQLPYYGGQYRIKKGGMMMNLQRIFIKDDILFFVFRLGNYSNISYDIQLTRFYVKDRKQKKRSSQMEQEIIPLYQYMITDQKVKV